VTFLLTFSEKYCVELQCVWFSQKPSWSLRKTPSFWRKYDEKCVLRDRGYSHMKGTLHEQVTDVRVA